MTPIHYLLAVLLLLALVETWGRRLGPRAPSVFADARAIRHGVAPATIRARLEGRNNFLVLRLFAASFVLWYHSYALTGLPGHDPLTRNGIGLPSGLLAVYVFFAGSGFLVAASWSRRPSLGSFLLARAWRIVPGLLLCVVATTLLLGLAMTALPARDYLAHPQTWRYITGNMQFAAEHLVFELPGVFEGRGVNGSLWTLPAEVAMYAWLAVAGVFGALRRPMLLLTFVAAWLGAGILLGPGSVLIAVPEYLPMGACFWMGCLAWRFREHIVLRTDVAAGLFVVCWLFAGTPAYMPLLLVTVVYGTLWAALVPRLPAWTGKLGDYSYGIYLWGVPVQQLMLSAFGAMSPGELTVLAWPVAALVAMFSWHAIEEPVLRRFAGRAASTARSGAQASIKAPASTGPVPNVLDVHAASRFRRARAMRAARPGPRPSGPVRRTRVRTRTSGAP